MSRQNKVNPGRYTTKGRLTPDDLGRELKRQKNVVVGAAGKAARAAWEATAPATTAVVKKAKESVRALNAGPIERTVVGAARAAGKAVGVVSRVAAKVTPARRKTAKTATAAKRGSAKSAKAAPATRAKTASAKAAKKTARR